MNSEKSIHLNNLLVFYKVFHVYLLISKLEKQNFLFWCNLSFEKLNKNKIICKYFLNIGAVKLRKFYRNTLHGLAWDKTEILTLYICDGYF